MYAEHQQKTTKKEKRKENIKQLLRIKVKRIRTYVLNNMNQQQQQLGRKHKRKENKNTIFD